MPFANLTIGKNEFLLLYDFNALVDAEEEAGCNLLAAFERQGNNTARELRGLLFAMTRKKHDDLDIKQIGALINMDTLRDVTLAIGEACAVAVSEEFAEKWREAVDIVADVDKEANPRDEQIPEVSDSSSAHLGVCDIQAYQAGGDLSGEQMAHLSKCSACFAAIDGINAERLKVA